MIRHALVMAVWFHFLALAGDRLSDGSRATAAEPGVDYVRQVLPILSRNCFTCHGPDESSRVSDLRLDRFVADALGDDGEPASDDEVDAFHAAIVAGDPDSSELIARITSDDVSVRMPPAETERGLTQQEIETLRRWIEQGAKYEEHWALVPPRLVDPPEVRDAAWPRNEIDRFVLAELERRDIAPSPEADRVTLIRRLSFDLRGLPPTIEEVDQYLADRRPGAYDRLVDRMLASPQLGERLGKHWLDLARYADSDGYLGDPLRPDAYVYRDWVIGSINRDQPIDEFTVEQLAGDLLPDATLEQKIATGFHRNVMKNTEAGADREEDRVNRTVNYVSTTGTVWLGLTVGCAECHSHKYDPISIDEFYGLYAFFNNVEDVNLPLPDSQTLVSTTAKVATPSGDPGKPSAEPGKGDPKTEPPSLKAPTIGELAASKRRVTRVHPRGDFRNPGKEVTPATPAVFHSLRTRGDQPDRLDLANWLIDPENPLTHRVTVNHLWKQLFGRGLVNTPENFGTTGDPPSHPELLDWLALRMVDQQWSRKAMVRLIVQSATYRQASRVRPELRQIDAHNVLLARQSRPRLEAEVVRDAALAVSGLLNTAIGGPSIRPPMDLRVTSYSRNKDWPVSPGAEKYRRGLYVLLRRNTLYSMLVTFDAPDTSVSCTARERSNSPLQALTLLNDPVFHECAQHLARRLSAAGTERPRYWIADGFRHCLAREPDDHELDRLVELYLTQRDQFADLDDVEVDALIGQRLEGIDPRDQAARLIVARTLINLHEFITRE